MNTFMRAMFWSLVLRPRFFVFYCSLRISAVADIVNAVPSAELPTTSLAIGCSTMNENG